MSKPKFKLEDYPDEPSLGVRFAMHCPEKWMAETFFKFLRKDSSKTGWDFCCEYTCYDFNKFAIFDKRDPVVLEHNGNWAWKQIAMKILEFSDFDWSDGTDINVPTKRPSKDEYYLGIAKAVAMRSTCLRRQYGAVIVKDDFIVSTGYNGSARGEANCIDVGKCWREEHNIPHGEQYEKCVAVHAEDNAISQAGRQTIGATLYLAGFENGKVIKAEPCMMCARKIKNAQIVRVVGTEAE